MSKKVLIVGSQGYLGSRLTEYLHEYGYQCNGIDTGFFEEGKFINNLILEPESKINFSDGEYIDLSQPLTQGFINPHEKLNTIFSYYKTRLPVNEACKIAFKKIQLFFVIIN